MEVILQGSDGFPQYLWHKKEMRWDILQQQSWRRAESGLWCNDEVHRVGCI
jgi:hypothetical protein